MTIATITTVTITATIDAGCGRVKKSPPNHGRFGGAWREKNQNL